VKVKLLFVVAVAALVAAPFEGVLAGSMRCGVHLIQDAGRTGPGKYEVLKKCGEPSFRDGNTWVYEKSSKKHVVTFDERGLVRTITSG